MRDVSSAVLLGSSERSENHCCGLAMLECASKKPAAQSVRGRLRVSSDRDQLPLMVEITLDIGRAFSSPPPNSLSTISLYFGSGSTGVLPTICTIL